MSEDIIRRGLAAKVAQLYEMAEKYEPQDWGGAPCPHRQKVNIDDLECMHQLRRELFKLAFHTGGRNGIWYLKSK